MAYFLSPALAQLRAEINALWPHRDKTSDGWIGDTSHAARPSDHNPDWADGGIVRAIDIDEDLVAGLAEVGAAMPLVEQIIRDPRVAYVIYEGRIWQNPAVFKSGGWQPYTGVNAHRHHVHVSVRRGARWDRLARAWGIAAGVADWFPSRQVPTVADLEPPAPLIPLEDNMKVIRDTQTGSIALVGEAYVGEFGGADSAGYGAAIAVFGPMVEVTNAEYVTTVQRATGRMAAARAGMTAADVAAQVVPSVTAAIKALPAATGVDQAAVEKALRNVLGSLG